FSRSTSRNTATRSGRSPWRRRLRLFLESRAPREGSSLLVGVAVALRAPVLSSLLARLRRSRPTAPTCAATPRQFRDPGRSLSWVCRSHARDERPRHETQVGMVDAFAACLNLLDGHLSDTSLLCPPNRVKLSERPGAGWALMTCGESPRPSADADKPGEEAARSVSEPMQSSCAGHVNGREITCQDRIRSRLSSQCVPLPSSISAQHFCQLRGNPAGRRNGVDS